MSNIKVTVEWSAEDRARLDKIIELLGKPIMFGGADFAPAKTEPKLEEVKPEPVKEAPAQTVTREDVKALVQKLIAPTTEEAKRTAARAFVKGYANKVSEIPDDKLTEVYNGLSELDKGA